MASASDATREPLIQVQTGWNAVFLDCLLYTSDAADERSSVDLGGRRIIKKKKSTVTTGYTLDRTMSAATVQRPKHITEKSSEETNE